MGGPRLSAVVLAQDRRAFLPEAVRSAIDAGADEVIVVRNFADPIPGAEGRFRDVRCDVPETGEKHARGVEAATGEIVAFLDDDDRWKPEKGPRMRAAFASTPGLAYLSHAQSTIGEDGAPVSARHPEHAGRAPGRFASWDRNDFADLAERIWPGNGSSTVVAREWALDWVPSLRAVGWSADTFWLVAAVLSGRPMTMLDAPLTDLRLHQENMSHARDASPEEFRRRHGEQSGRFARAFETMAGIAREQAGPSASIARYLDGKATGFRFFAQLEGGNDARAAAAHALARGNSDTDRGARRAAGVALFSPALARRLLYRSNRRRWSLA
jgi:hypothetical protein